MKWLNDIIQYYRNDAPFRMMADNVLLLFLFLAILALLSFVLR